MHHCPHHVHWNKYHIRHCITKSQLAKPGEWGDCDFENIECRTLPPLPQARPQVRPLGTNAEISQETDITDDQAPPEAVPALEDNLQDARGEAASPLRPQQVSTAYWAALEETETESQI